MDDLPPRRDRRSPIARIAAATAVALAFALGIYLLLDSVQPGGGLISFSFLLVLPAALSAFVCYVADPWAERRLRTYLLIPVWLLLLVIVASLVFLHEGTVCVVILSPLWLIGGMIGAWITYRLRRRRRAPDYGETFRGVVWLGLPLIAMQVEPHIPLPADTATVSRSIVVAASPERIWPLLEGVPDVQPGEGRWNVTQDVIGVPRPLGARLVGQGIGAERLARWGDKISFRERINEWQPGRRIGWRFIFDDLEGWKFTDRHLMPDSPYWRITTGGYRMEPLDGGRTRVTLHTAYWLRTPLNLYSEAWGQFFLGDVENNLLALIKQRAERQGTMTATDCPHTNDS